MEEQRKIILASQSPRRRELLSLLGLPFEVISPRVNEYPLPGETPQAYARRLSQEKAQAIQEVIGGDTLILAADTIVVDGDDILEKPRDSDEAVSMLRRLRGRTHTVYTALTLLDSTNEIMVTEAPGSP